MSEEQERWQHSHSNSKVVRRNVSHRSYFRRTALYSLNLKSYRACDCAGQVPWSHKFTRFQTQSSKVFGGVGAMTKATGCWGGPSRNASEFTTYLQRVTGVYINYSTDANRCQSKGINNLEGLTLNFDAWDNVTEPNPAERKEQPQKSRYQVAIAKENWLASCQCSQQNRTDCYHVTRGGSLTHSHLAFAKGAK